MGLLGCSGAPLARRDGGGGGAPIPGRGGARGGVWGGQARGGALRFHSGREGGGGAAGAGRGGGGASWPRAPLPALPARAPSAALLAGKAAPAVAALAAPAPARCPLAPGGLRSPSPAAVLAARRPQLPRPSGAPGTCGPSWGAPFSHPALLHGASTGTQVCHLFRNPCWVRACPRAPSLLPPGRPPWGLSASGDRAIPQLGAQRVGGGSGEVTGGSGGCCLDFPRQALKTTLGAAGPPGAA